jgi:hypothetical protein
MLMMLPQKSRVLILAKELLDNSTWSSVKPYAQRESKAIKDFNQKLWDEIEEKKPPPEPPKLRVLRSS